MASCSAGAHGARHDDVALATGVLTFPVNPAYGSLNLAQAVLLCAYNISSGGGGAFPMNRRKIAAGAA